MLTTSQFYRPQRSAFVADAAPGGLRPRVRPQRSGLASASKPFSYFLLFGRLDFLCLRVYVRYDPKTEYFGIYNTRFRSRTCIA